MISLILFLYCKIQGRILHIAALALETAFLSDVDLVPGPMPNRGVTRVWCALIRTVSVPANSGLFNSLYRPIDSWQCLSEARVLPRKMGVTLTVRISMSLLWLCAMAPLLAWSQNNQEQCQLYYGGLVFPEGSRPSLEHGMHWSKTQSESHERDRVMH